MRIAILGNAGSWYCGDLTRAAAARGHAVERCDFPRIVARNGFRIESPAFSVGAASLSDFDAVVVRTMPPGTLEQVVYRMDVLARLEAAGVVVVNPPKSLECAVDKYLTTSRLEAAGLPVPATVVCENSEDALAAFDRLGGDVVVKPLFGSEGRGIVRVSDPDLALRTFRTLERIGAVLYVQQYVAHRGFDTRVLVLDGRVLGGMRRRSSSDFRTNVSRHAEAESYAPSDGEAEWALRAASATNAVFAGIDLLYDADGLPYVIEVNAVPGWRAFARVNGCDVAGEVVAWLEGVVGLGSD